MPTSDAKAIFDMVDVLYHQGKDAEYIAGAVSAYVAPAPVPGDDQDELERLREALREIASRTYDTQYSPDATTSVVKFAGGIHDIARAAIEPAPASDEVAR